MKKYSELLPSYLNGPNIHAHAQIIESEDVKLFEKIDFQKIWNTLERPILIERIGEPESCTLYFHIHTNNPIHRIYITLEGEQDDLLEEFQEKELITEYENDIRYSASTIRPGELVCMPRLIVKVETYDGPTYIKGYFENDSPQGNPYDHDEYLDKIGALLGIPRRIYKELDYYEPSAFNNTYPPFFSKQHYTDKQEGDIITEDDYYYKERLKKYIVESQDKPLPVLLLELLYEWQNIQYSSMTSRNTSITDEIVNYAGKPFMQLINGTTRYLNMDYTNMEQIIQQYAPITRGVVLRNISNTYLSTDNGMLNSYPQNMAYLLYELEDQNGNFIDKAPLQITTSYHAFTVYTDKNNINQDNMHQIPLPGFKPQNSDVQINYPGEYEFRTSNTEQFSVYPEDYYHFYYESDDPYSTMSFKHYSLSSIADSPPRMNHDYLLSVGKGVICYTPGIYLPILSEDKVFNFELNFRFGGTNCQLGLTNIIQVDDTKANWNSKLTIRPSNFTSRGYNITHILGYYIQGREVRIELDGNEIKTYSIPEGQDLLQIAGYNGTAENDNNNAGLYFEDAHMSIT